MYYPYYIRYLLLLLLKFCILIPHSSASETTSTEDPTREVLDKLVDMKHRALDWLTSQRKPDYGWGTDTSRVIISISAAVDDWPQKNDSEAMLIAKQMEVELLAKLLRYSEEPIPPPRLGYYAIALNAICRDPRDYYGHNLVGLMEKHTEDWEYPGYPETYGFSLSSLVSCLGGSHLHRRQIHHLIKITQDNTRLHSIGKQNCHLGVALEDLGFICHLDSLEMRAMALLALKCVYEHRGLEGIHRILHDGYEALGGLQKPDGSFGNIHTTTLIIQGLGLNENFEYWNDTSGILGLAALQSSDGSFEHNMLGTTDALLAITTLLNGSGILKLKRHQCSTYSFKPLESIMSTGVDEPNSHTSSSTRPVAWDRSAEKTIPIDSEIHKGPTTSTSSYLPGVTNEEPSSQTPVAMSPTVVDQMSLPAEASSRSLLLIKYSLWIGADPRTAETHNLTMSVPLNTSFFHVMQRAAELDPAFEFTSTLWPNGHYVHTISGHREQPIGYNYWLLYRLSTDPDPMNPPPTTYVAEKGVDDLVVQDGDIYLFWFKKV